MNVTLELFWGQLLLLIPKLLWAVGVALVGMVAIKMGLSLLKNLLLRTKIDPTLHAFLLATCKITLWVLLAITLLDLLGVPTASLITSLGAVGLALSLAVKDSLANLAGGVVMLFLKPFALGDYIQVDGQEGTVCEIGIVHTLLRTVDNRRVYLPNGDVAKAKIVNFSAEPLRRLDLVFSIGYEADFRKAIQVVHMVINKNALAATDPAPLVRLGDHGLHSLDLTCRVWVENQSYAELRFSLLEEVKEAFDQEGISIPYQQVDVHMVP